MALGRLRQSTKLKSGIVPFIAGFAGVAAGIGVSFAALLPLMRTAVASAAGEHTISMAPASTVEPVDCAPAGFSGKGGGVLGESAGQAPNVMQAVLPAAQSPNASRAASLASAQAAASTPNAAGKTFIAKLTNAAAARASAAITNTGPSSKNDITTVVSNKTTIANTNSISLPIDNKQAAASGGATVIKNTSAGGADTGGASNGNNSTATLNLSN